MAIWARMILVLLAGSLPATPVLAAKPSVDIACSPLAAVPALRDAEVTALSMQPEGGRCVVEVKAANGKALLRQQRMLEVLTQHACAAPAEVSVDDTRLSLQLRLPKHCAARGSRDLFAGEGVAWKPARGVSPHYPPEAMQQGLSGRSLLKALIDAKGTVAAVIVETSSGHALLDEAAVDELRGWPFVRAEAESTVPELTIVRVPMRYALVE
ncbi:energy transducer TonB [Stenotrophomonas maltophilia]|uniref:energy transducer TonB n=1 Tax=Stenotrophomonas maltophilia TaxID=40324 RepID=UPI0010943876|nr:energy transducer TonB [Stenotrophomonas maltophilia]TGW20551.1 energy transducer TonB [Stenotrophomonas maltophilia]